MSEQDTAATTFAYDAVAYPSPIVPSQTPDRIAAAALLHGYDPPDPLTASVLEIGCGDGLNLIAAAGVAPRSHCVGFDLSAPAIARGNDLAAAAGLANVELYAGDIVTWPRDGERYDYIIAHGVYSWVPDFVRESMLELVAARLAPGGFAYISFDCSPASIPKSALSEFLIGRLGGTHSIPEQAGAALDLIETLSRNQAPGSVYRAGLDQLIETKSRNEPGYLVHDILEPYYRPVSTGEFAAAAGRHGLDYVADVGLVDLYLADLDDEARALVNAAPDFVARAKLLDMLHGDSTFRRALLVRRDAPAPRSADSFVQLRFGFYGQRKETDGQLIFEGVGRSRLNQARGAYRDIMNCFADNAPEEMTLDDILAQTTIPAGEAIGTVCDLASAGLIEAFGSPQPFVMVPGERPAAGALIRTMFASGGYAINLRHLRITAGDSTRLFVVLCDGSRTRAELAAAMSSVSGTDVPLEHIEDAIADLAAQAVFVA